jgi:hypothetical protein
MPTNDLGRASVNECSHNDVCPVHPGEGDHNFDAFGAAVPVIVLEDEGPHAIVPWRPMSKQEAMTALSVLAVRVRAARVLDAGLTVSKPDRNGVVRVRSDEAEIRIVRHSLEDDGSDRAVLVETELAEQLSPELAEIGAVMRAAEGVDGIDPDGPLRTRYEQPWRDAQVAVARTAVVLLARAGLLDNNDDQVRRAVDGAVFDRNAGCQGCGGCTPGVVLGERLRRDGSTVTLYVRRRRPEPQHRLLPPAMRALRAAAAGRLKRQEIRSPFRYYVEGDDRIRVAPATAEALIHRDLLRTGERSGSVRPILITEAGEREVFARS